MKISPLEIRQKTFEKNFRGYDKDEVDAFLLSLSQEWERVMDENKDLKMRLAHSEKEVQKLREVETTLYKTLKTAEDTGANIVSQANKSAELLTKESQMNAEAILGDARTKAKNLFEDAEEKVKNILFLAQNKVNELVIEIRSLDAQKQNLVNEIKQVATSLIDRANVAAASTQIPDFNKMLSRDDNPKLQFKDESPAAELVVNKPASEKVTLIEKKEEEVIILPPAEPEKEPKTVLSFFDQIN